MLKTILCLFLLLFVPKLEASQKQAVSYTFSGGRFGDNLLAYLHAKWVSHIFGIELLYKPFPYSDHLVLHELEKPFDPFHIGYSPVITLKYQEMLFPPRNPSYLFIIPYFPECLFEHRPKEQYPYFPVGWDDPDFIAKIKKMVSPLKKVPDFPFPEGRVNVALHFRSYKGFDTQEAEDAFPLKFPSIEYYLEQVGTLYELLDQSPLYVYIFTDHPDPKELLELFNQTHAAKNILFDARVQGNHHNSHVIEDFFSMTQFDCMVRGESNFALTAAKIANFDIEIYPVGFKKVNGKNLIDQVYIKTKSYR